MLNIYKIKKLACAHRNEIVSLHNCILNQKIFSFVFRGKSLLAMHI